MVNIDFLHGGNIYEIKRRYKKDVIDFSANINPLGLTKAIKREFSKCYRLIPHYPDLEANDLIRQIAKYWSINEENILIGNGSTELIYLIAHAFKPKKALIPAPTFSEYERACKMSYELRVTSYKLKEKNNFEIDIDKFIITMRKEKCDMVFLSNPNNPTGKLLRKNDLLKIAETAKNLKCYLVIDEAFMDFLPDEGKHTFIPEAAKDKRFIVLRSFTKFFAIPGLRIGYMIAHNDLVKRLRKIQPPWSANSIAQYLAQVLLNNKEYIEKTHRLINKEREFLFKELVNLKELKPYPSVTNFFLVKIIDNRIDSTILTKKLINKGIFIRDCSNFKKLNNRFIRIAVRSHKENSKLIKTLRELLKET